MGKEVAGYLIVEGEATPDPIVVNISIEKSDAENTLILEYWTTKLVFDVKELLDAVIDELLAD